MGSIYKNVIPDIKVHGANMGPTWGRQDPGGPHVGHMNLAIWDGNSYYTRICYMFLILSLMWMPWGITGEKLVMACFYQAEAITWNNVHPDLWVMHHQ